MMRLVIAALLFVAMASRSLFAQEETVWVQIEAQPTLAEALGRARDYATQLQDVNGFAVRGGWYAIVLGPYQRDDAEQVLRVYRAEGKIPRDSFIAYTGNFDSQFWPVGTAGLTQPATPPAETSQPVTQPEAQPTVQAQPEQVLPDETLSEARASEAALSRDERMELQRLLQWAGFYTSSIDGAFGRGTRASMAAWQEAYGHEPTGVLTTGQRAELLDQYNAILKGLDVQTVADATVGITMKLPLGAVKFDRYEAPYAHFAATGAVPEARVLLISQTGDRNTLYGLYDIMQTLKIVPLKGPRKLDGDSFTLVGQGARFVSHTEASLQNGQIKGFTLIWPIGDEERRARLLDDMRASFARTEGVLDPAAGSTLDQRVDLVSGLATRQPKLTRSGFYVDPKGAVVTTADAVAACTRITLDADTEATVLATDAAQGIAVLRPKQTLAPMAVARFQTATPRLQSEVAVAGYSYGGVLDAPTLTFGTLADLRGLQGEETLERLAMVTLPGDAGGPVYDTGGEVLGMLLPRAESNRQLPEDVSFALDGAVIRQVLKDAGIKTEETDQITDKAPEDLTVEATGMTVLVSCWE
ncbi:peptidoglycan-binding protein [Thalassobius vesicularis]|uniref:Peptidoglycan-binding protein n=2 Tax=Thalassobius vesicularis TaxID=1294297 RepID=A0A4S3MCQ2_9RHOB|nr:serine protease [Thalassobius vesicularis]THD75642.1 peptidoglycan-binding protein [Thalassobius vesicularis]